MQMKSRSKSRAFPTLSSQDSNLKYPASLCHFQDREFKQDHILSCGPTRPNNKRSTLWSGEFANQLSEYVPSLAIGLCRTSQYRSCVVSHGDQNPAAGSCSRRAGVGMRRGGAMWMHLRLALADVVAWFQTSLKQHLLHVATSSESEYSGIATPKAP